MFMIGCWLLTHAHTTVLYGLIGIAVAAYAVMLRDVAQEVRG
jgi:hypothetical protein